MFSNTRNLLLVLIGLCIEISLLIFILTQDSDKNITTYIIVYAISFILFYVAYLFVKRETAEKTINLFNRWAISSSLVIIFSFGILFRLTLLPASPSTSDDVYRYIWEGKILSYGHNPFELAPDDKKLTPLHSEVLPVKVSYKDMTTIYPPVAQLVFAAGYLISGENDFGLKIIYLIAEILTFIFIIKILRLRKLSDNLLILYAWLPLPMMEYFINSHIDVVGISFFVVFLYYILQDKYLIAVLPFALSVLTKLYPLMILPLLIKKLRLKKTIYFTCILVLILTAAFYPFIPRDRSINESLFTYLSTWSFNGSLYSLFNWIFNDSHIARSLTLTLFVIGVGNIAIRYNDFLKGVYGVWICFIMFATTLYPWYLGWISAINPFFAVHSVTSLLFTSNATNFTPAGETWQEYWWTYLIQYIPFYFLLAKEVWEQIKDGTFKFR